MASSSRIVIVTSAFMSMLQTTAAETTKSAPAAGITRIRNAASLLLVQYTVSTSSKWQGQLAGAENIE
nr:hypothetical protein CFP56_20709 [Quercus suber]